MMTLYYYFWKFCFRIFWFFLCPTTIEGKENLPKEGSFILAANHLSNFDPFLIGSFCPQRMDFLAKESLFRNKLLGAWIAGMGAFPIKRDSADFRGIRETLRRLKKRPLLIFPEGTRISDNKKSQPGIGFVALKSGVEVYPVFIKGSEHVLPPHSKIPKRHPIKIVFGKPISIAKDQSYEEISTLIIQSIYNLSRFS